MAKKKGKKNSNASPNKAHARAKAEIEARQAAKKAAKRAKLEAQGIDPNKKKRHGKRRKAALPYNDDVTLNHDIVYTISNGNIVIDGAKDVTLVTDGGIRCWTTKV